MSKKKPSKISFRTVLLAIAIVALGAVGVVGYAIFTSNKDKSNDQVLWSYDEKKDEWYVKEGKAPACREPFVFDYTPVNLDDATSVGFAGTYRGKSYKVHGTFGLSKSSVVKLPADATLSGMTHYYEGDPLELQYLVSFETDCGIAFYFDHLNTLSPSLQELAKKLPEPKVNDTRVNPDDAPPRIKMKAGDIVATETGAHKSLRYGIDFGVIDYRQRNIISQNPKWVGLHSAYRSSEWYGVCWFDMLPGDDAARAEQLSMVQVDTRKVAKFVSDYCENADYTTLDLFDGQPVDSY